MRELICIVCPKGCHLQVDEENGCRVTGNACPRGAVYGREELLNPVRTVTTTMRVAGGMSPRAPVKTARPVPKDRVFEAMQAINAAVAKAPVAVGETLASNLLGLGNAATPLGIQAARQMSRRTPGRASDALCMLVVCNTASIQLIPTTVASVRLAAGCAAPFDILPAVWLASVISVCAGIGAVKLFGRVWRG